MSVFTKLHANKFKRNIPTMAGLVFVTSIAVVSLFNLNRGQTWLPLAALMGGAAVGLIDDLINIRGEGKGVAGMRSGLKFISITAIGLVLGWFFFVKLGIDVIHIPFLGNWTAGWLIVAVVWFCGRCYW